MDNQKKPSGFGIGVLIGSILGGLAAFFLSPNSGEENRQALVKKYKKMRKYLNDMELEKKVKEVWGDLSEDGEKTFLKVRKILIAKLELLEAKMEKFDYDKYVKLVEDSIEEVKSDTQQTAEKLLKLKDLFIRDWNKVFSEKK